MKLKLTKESLLAGLQAVQNVVGMRSTLPILANVLITTTEDKIALTTTDLDLSVRCGIDGEIGKSGTTTLPVRRIAGIVRELPESDIEIVIDDKDVATVTCGPSYFKIVGMSGDEFPPIAKADGKYSYRIDQGVFRGMLSKCAYAASTEETRYILNGVHLNFSGGKLTMVTTDGRRLALIEQEVEFPKEAEKAVVLPNKTVAELLRLLGNEGEMNICIKDNVVLFEFGRIQLTSKLIEGTYPNYRQVIPAKCEERVNVERESFLTALKRVALLSTEKSSAAKLTFGKNKLTITISTPDVGEARETLPVKYAGKEIAIAFNPEFMMDPLKNLTNDEVAIEITDDLSPGVIKCDMPFLYVLMPMRVS